MKVDKIAIEFCSTVLSVGERLKPIEVLYWARNKEKLKKLLRKPRFEIITHINTDPYEIPEIPGNSRLYFWRKKLMDPIAIDNFTECMQKTQRATVPAHVYSFRLNVGLYKEELIAEIGDIEDLKRTAFSYGQIAWFTSRHRRNLKKPGILDYNKKNYFPFIDKDGRLIFIGAFARTGSFGRHKGWRTYFQFQEDRFFHEGVLHMRYDVPDQPKK